MIALAADFILFSLFCSSAVVFGILSFVLVPDRWYYKRAFRGPLAFDTTDVAPFGALVALSALVLVVLGLSLPFFHPTVKGHGTLEIARSIFESRDAYMALLSSVGLWLSGYLSLGVVWGIVYFGLYATRLQRLFTETKETWLRTKGVASLEALSLKELEAYEAEVYGTVKRAMFYNGDFPLKPTQQKRFFFANAALWPISVLWYFLGEFMIDLGRAVWSAIKRVVRAYWEKQMSLYLADLELTRKYAGLMQEAMDAQRRNDRSLAKKVTGIVQEALQRFKPQPA